MKQKNLIFWALILMSAIVFGQQRNVKTIITPNGKEIKRYQESYALIIGNGNYSLGWDPLPGALKDANEVTIALKNNGFNVTTKKDVTRDGFEQAFGEFALINGKNKNNRLLFYFAGHGHTIEMANEEQLGYLVMIDAPDPDNDPVGFDRKSIDMEYLVTQAKKIKAEHVLFMFDCCFSGTILNLRDRVTPAAISDMVKYPVRQFITAGRAHEPVPDHSYFKQAFLDILAGRDKELIPDGYLTGEELGLYLKNIVPTYNPNQHPQYGKIRDPKLDKGDFVFIVPKTAEPVIPEKPSVVDSETEKGSGTINPAKKFYIVSETFLIEDNAKRHLSFLKEKGYYSAEIIITEDGRFAVCYISYLSREDAEDSLEKLRIIENNTKLRILHQ